MASKSGEDMVVRMHPYNPAKGHVMRTCTIPDPSNPLKSHKFRHDFDGWYGVSGEIAEVLRGVHSRPDNANTPLAFIVKSKAELLQEVRAERKRQQEEEAQANIMDVSSPAETSSRPSSKRKPARVSSKDDE